jgi:hypothetical protein
VFAAKNHLNRAVGRGVIEATAGADAGRLRPHSDLMYFAGFGANVFSGLPQPL